MNYILIGALVLGFYSAGAQTLEDKVAAKSCECLQKAKEATETVKEQCLMASLKQVIIADTSRSYLRQLSTVEAVQNLTRNVYTRLATQCDRSGSKRKKY